MRILALVTDAFGGHGGIAKFNRDLLTALCTSPDCVEVVAVPRLMPNQSESLPEKLTYVDSGLDNKFRYMKVVRQVVKANPAFDLILCGHINLLPVAWLERFVTKAPLVLVIHGIDAWQPTRSRLVNTLVKRVDAFVAVSEFTRQKFCLWSKIDPNKGHILPNCVDAEKYGPGPKNPDLLRRYGLEGKTVLMTLGRLVSHERYKGFDEVLEVLPELAREIPDIAYMIVGKGDDQARLEANALSLGIADRVIFAGFIPEEEKADHYRLADAYVMPSRGEGFGIVFLEALACGIPCIGSKVDGSREALRDGALGVLVDPASPEELKEAIVKALGEGRGDVPEGLEYFSFDNFIQRLHGIVGQAECRLSE